MARFQCFRVYVVHVVGVEDTRATAIKYGLFARGVSEAKATPAVGLVSGRGFPVFDARN